MSSYRMAQLSPAFQALLKELSTEHLQTPWTMALSVKRLRSNVQLKKMKKEQLDGVGEMAGEGTGGQEEEKSEVKLTKQEARRLRKEQRKKEVSWHCSGCIAMVDHDIITVGGAYG